MNYRTLGSTGIKVSEIGMGCWGIGSNSYGHSDDVVSIVALREARLQGVNFFDTADIYGDGHSEELIGHALADWRDSIILATKVGSLPHTGKVMPVSLDPMHIGGSLGDSLRRLQTNYIDLYQLHSPPLHLLEAAVDAISIYKHQDMVKYIGVSCKSPDDGLIAIQDPRVDVIQVNYNMIDQRVRQNGLLDKCQDKGIGVIARTPLAFGFLTGKYHKGYRFHTPDHRANWSQEQIDIWAEAPLLFRQIAANHGITMTQLALGFCLSHPAISTVIPGMMTPLEVLENTSKYQLTPQEVAIIHSIYNSNNFFIEE